MSVIDDESATLTLKVANGSSGGDEPGKLDVVRTKKLTKEEFDAIADKFTAAGFWTMASKKSSGGKDGARWVAVKHSGTKRIEVQLKEDSSEVSLIIHDSGKGFDVTAAMQGHGLGLTSMKERVRLVNGTITIQSNGRDGTTIHASVPLSSKHNSQRATG